MKKLKAIIMTFVFMLTLSVPVLAKATSIPNPNTPKRTQILAIASLSNGMDVSAELIFTQAAVQVAELVVDGVEYELPAGDLYISPSMNKAYLNTFVTGIGQINLTWDVKDLEAIREKLVFVNTEVGYVDIAHTLFSSYIDGTPVSGTIDNTNVTGSGFCFTGFFIYQDIK